MAWESARQPFILMLFSAGVLAVLLGEVRDGLLVLAGLVPIVGADVVTTFRAERALDALRAASAPRARVRRDGAPLEIPAREVVVGDLLLLTSGDVVPADGRVVTTRGGLVDRSVLTGESLPEPLAGTADASDDRAMVHAGTSLVAGSAEAVVVATGHQTEVGHISAALGPEKRRRSPVQAELDRLVRIALAAALALVALCAALERVSRGPASRPASSAPSRERGAGARAG